MIRSTHPIHVPEDTRSRISAALRVAESWLFNEKTNLTGRTARCASAVHSRGESADYRLSRASLSDQGTVIRLTESFNGRHRSRGSPNKVKLIAEEQNGQTSDKAAIRSPQCSAIVDCFQVAVAQACQPLRRETPELGIVRSCVTEFL